MQVQPIVVISFAVVSYSQTTQLPTKTILQLSFSLYQLNKSGICRHKLARGYSICEPS